MDGPLNKKFFKIRAGATKEEIIQKISDVMNIPPEMINLDFQINQAQPLSPHAQMVSLAQNNFAFNKLDLVPIVKHLVNHNS
jgi:hypothetical protein